jgi:beta-galactosidase
VAGTTTPAEVAILFDWDNRWAIKDAQGPRNKGIHYEETVLAHHRAFWEEGVSVDVIGSEDDFSTYKLIVAPMLYLCREETGSKLEKFVEQGGTLVTTYWSGIVNEHDLCHLGGFPGPLRKTLGIWAEEIEGLYDHDRNGLIMSATNSLGLTGTFESHEICEIIHSEGAEILGVYTDSFYAGMPALTVNQFGEGKAYHMATRLKPDFLHAFYKKIIEQTGVVRALEAELPLGVTAQVRTDGSTDYVFIMNFSGESSRVSLDDDSYFRMESNEPVTGTIELAVNGIELLKRKAK